MNPTHSAHPVRSARRFPLIALLLLLAAAGAWAAPFRDLLITYTQPDGTKVQLRGSGDEFYAIFETLDGYTVVFDQARRAYCFAQKAADGTLASTGVEVQRGAAAAAGLPPHVRADQAARVKQVQERYQRWDAGTDVRERWNAVKAALHERETQNESGTPKANGGQPGPPGHTTTGNRLGLTLLIDFDNDPATISQSQIFDFCNSDNFTAYGNNGSVKKYYQEVSNGLLIYSNVVTIYIRIPNSLHPKSYYNDVTKDAGDQANLLIRDAITIMKALPNYATEILPTFNDVNVDGNNNVVAFNVFYAGDNGNVWSMGLWPHSWSLYNVGAQSLSTGGKKVYRYQVSNIGDALEIGTFCHENGHMLCGYPDLYDYTGDSEGVGNWCLMAGGSWGGSPAGSNPAQVCAYLKRASGWATTTDLTSTSYAKATVSVNAGPDFNHFYRLQKPGVSTEYFLAECRYKAGRDGAIPGSGVLIWHIDELGDNSSVNLNPNSIHDNYEATLVQADNKWHLEKNQNGGDANDPYYSGNATSGYANLLSDSSAPNAHWWNGSTSGAKFYNFSVRGTTMTFEIGDPPPVANFVASPTSGAAPLTNVLFTDLSTGVITSRSWDFGDGETLPNTTETNVLHTYQNVGIYSPSLTVVGPNGTSITNRISYIVVTNNIPVADFAGLPTSGLAPLKVQFANTSSGQFTNSTWFFGEGGMLSTNGLAVSHTYSNAGNFSVSLTVFGPGGTTTTNKASYISVSNGAPVSVFTASRTNGPAALQVAFTNSSQGMISSVLWDFGDGHTTNDAAPILTNTYALAGAYTVSLTVTGPYGTGVSTNLIVVTNAAPEPAFAVDKSIGFWPLTVAFTNLSAYATNYTWLFGDGATTNTSSTNVIWHTYNASGSYPVCLTASGLGGIRTLCSNAFVVVTNPPPPTVSFAAWPTNGMTALTVWFTNLSLVATNYTWDFGDGTTLVTTDPSVFTHTYYNASNYSVCLTAIGQGGTNALCRNDYILATNRPPNIAAVGDNSSGQCVMPVHATNIIAVAAGAWHNLALKPEGTVVAWGDNSYGQCNVPADLRDAAAVAAGGYHSLAIRRNGTVAAWGAGDYGQTQVPAQLHHVVGIAAGTWHSVALRADGTVVVWGDDTFGQNNQPAGLSNVTAIAAGGNHTLALRADGTVAAWGENTDPGGGLAGQSFVPFGLTGVKAVGAGDYHSLVVRINGSPFAWGDDSQWQSSVPAWLTNAVAIAGGAGHSVALCANGAVAAWGANWNGQCQMPPMSVGAASIAAGEYHTLVLLARDLPPPPLFNPARKANTFAVQVPTLVGRTYLLECADSLAATSWTPISTNTGTGTLKTLIDNAPAGTQRFYRLGQW